MYHVRVSFHANNDHLFVRKDIVKCRVIHQGTRYLTISPWPEAYGDIKVPIDECYYDLEEAKKECELQAEVIVDKLQAGIIRMKAPAEILDKL